MESHVAKPGLELPFLILCLHLPNARITGICHHADCLSARLNWRWWNPPVPSPWRVEIGSGAEGYVLLCSKLEAT